MEKSQAPTAPEIRCPICDDTFCRGFTMKRHMVRIHGYTYEEYIHNNTVNIHNNIGNIHNNTGNIPNNTGNEIDIQNDKEYRCKKCDKCLYAKWYLTKHMEKCKGIRDKYSCEYCHKTFTHDTSRFKHYKICKSKKEIDSKSLVPVTDTPQAISQQVASTINNVSGDQNNNNTQNNIVNILTFPQSGDKNFDFVCDQITKATMKALLNASSTPFIGFNKFIGTVMENPQNRIVHKTNPNSTYSKIHVGDGKWEFAHDDDVFPVITHHMTTAALSKVNEMKDDMKLVKELYLKLEPFRNHITDVNEMDYESSEYKNILQRIKLILVNLTRKWMEEEKMS